jgi:hypothetical protein
MKEPGWISRPTSASVDVALTPGTSSPAGVRRVMVTTGYGDESLLGPSLDLASLAGKGPLRNGRTRQISYLCPSSTCAPTTSEPPLEFAGSRSMRVDRRAKER